MVTFCLFWLKKMPRLDKKDNIALAVYG